MSTKQNEGATGSLSRFFRNIRNNLTKLDSQFLQRCGSTVLLTAAYFYAKMRLWAVAESIGGLAFIALGLALDRAGHLFSRLNTKSRLRRFIHPPRSSRLMNLMGGAKDDKIFLVVASYLQEIEDPSQAITDQYYWNAAEEVARSGAWPEREAKCIANNNKKCIAMGDMQCVIKMSNVFAKDLSVVPRILTDIELANLIKQGKHAEFDGGVFFFVGIYSNFMTNLYFKNLQFQNHANPDEREVALSEDPNTKLALVPRYLHAPFFKDDTAIYIRRYDADGRKALPDKMIVKADAINLQDHRNGEYVPVEFLFTKEQCGIGPKGGDTIRATIHVIGGLTEAGTSAAGTYFANHWQDIYNELFRPDDRRVRDRNFVSIYRRRFRYATQSFCPDGHPTDEEHLAVLREDEPPSWIILDPN